MEDRPTQLVSNLTDWLFKHFSRLTSQLLP